MTQLAELELVGAAVVYGNAAGPPAAPTGVSAQAVSRSQIDLSWRDEADDEALYRIDAAAAGAAYQTVGYAPANANGHSVFGLAPGLEHSFRVVAINAAGEASSSPALATTLAPIPRTTNGDGTVTYADGSLQVTVDAVDQNIAPSYVEGLVTELFAVYPEMTGDFNPAAPTELSITFDPEYDGIAYAVFGTGSITISSAWARAAAPTSLDVITHEGSIWCRAIRTSARQPGSSRAWPTTRAFTTARSTASAAGGSSTTATA